PVIGIVSFLNRPVRAADAPFTGTWRLEIFAGGQELTLCLVKIEVKGGEPVASVLAPAPHFRGATVEDVTADARTLHFTFKGSGNVFRVTALLPEGEKRPQTLVGNGRLDGGY